MAGPPSLDPHDASLYEHLWHDEGKRDGFIKRQPLKQEGHSHSQLADDLVALKTYHFKSVQSLGEYFLESDLIQTAFGLDSIHALDELEDFAAVTKSAPGTAAWFREPSRLYLQTPRDDVGLSFSLISAENRRSGQLCTMLVSKDADTEQILYGLDQRGIPREWEHTDLPLVVLPLQILRRNVKYTSEVFSDLTQRVETAENQLLTSSEDLDRLIRALNRHNTVLLGLERRWNFERKLSATIREVIDEHKRANDTTDPFLAELDNTLKLQERLSQASEYGISILPRRIQNQFSAAYSLIAQRDTKATIRLAEESQRLATASLRDSSSMKTIAGMTLIFLPPTFICSFFSMSFFNFEATGTKSLWVYFATAAPLTAVVTLSWIAYNLWRREVDKKKLKLGDPESRPGSSSE